jgi:hypothetical protein
MHKHRDGYSFFACPVTYDAGQFTRPSYWKVRYLPNATGDVNLEPESAIALLRGTIRTILSPIALQLSEN